MSFGVALKWSFLSELSARIVPPLVFIVLARLLTPEDFGVVAAAAMVVAFSQIFWEAGMAKALIQHRGDRAAAADAAFWVNCMLAVVVAGLLVVAAGALAEGIFHDGRVTAVLQAMSLQVLLSAAVSVHTALLQKDMRFKPLFWVRLSTVALPALVSVPLALQGVGYWALIAGTLAGQAAQVILLWRISDWRPRLSCDWRVARDLARFGGWVGLSGLLAWFYVWADSLIVGIYLGSHELGLYRMGNQFAMMIFAIILVPIAPVLYSHLSLVGQDRERLRGIIEKVIRVLVLVAIPSAFVVYSLAEPIAMVLFGAPWHGVSLVIGVMALTHGFSWVAGMNGEFFRAMGKPSYEAVVAGAALAFYLAGYLVSIRYGFEAFIWTRFFLALGGLALHLFFLRRVISVTLLPIARHLLVISMLSAVVVAVVQSLLLAFPADPLWQLILGGSLSLLLLGAGIVFLDRDGILPEAAAIIRERAR